LICLIRKVPVAATPEEQVRQALLKFMIESGGYPRGLIGVELSLSALPHLIESQSKLPKRRADVIVFSQSTHLPLILVECKAVPLNEATIRQAIGYNLFVKAPYIILANEKEVKTGSFNGTAWVFNPGLPDYKSLTQ
jgi:hypothetical protein